MPLEFSTDSNNKNPDHTHNSVVYKGELIEVTNDNLFRRHYKKWFDEKDDVQAYYDDQEFSNPRKIMIGVITVTDCIVRSTDTRGTDLHPLEMHIDMNDDYENASRDNDNYIKKFFRAATRGRIKLNFNYVKVPHLLFETSGENWSGRITSFPANEILENYLKTQEDWQDLMYDIDIWVFNLDSNGVSYYNQNEDDSKFFKLRSNVTFNNVKFLNGRVMKIVQKLKNNVFTHESGHLFTHAFFESDGYNIFPFHGSGVMGYTDDDNNPHGYEWIGDTANSELFYFNMLKYYITPDMWERFNRGPNPITPPAIGGEYKYDDIKNDFQSLLPALTEDDIKTVTGFRAMVLVEDSITMIRVRRPERDDVTTTHYTRPTTDPTLSNCIDRKYNNVAVVGFSTGHWIFVKPSMLELFADMPNLSDYDIGESKSYLSIYGVLRYKIKSNNVNDGCLVLLKAPASLNPANELGYFVQNAN